MRRGTEPVNRVQVLGRRVALVRFPAIAGMAGGEPIHQIVADRLGDHRRRCDRVTARITIDDRFVLAAELRTGQAVDEHPRGREAEPVEGALHRENRGPPDVVAIDLVHAGGTYRDGERPFANLAGEPGPLQRRQHLRVVQAANRLCAHRKHDGRGKDWSSQWAAADFVDSGDSDPPVAPQRDFALERWTAMSHVSDCSPVLVPAPGTDAAVRPRFSRMRAALPASRRRKYSLARRTRPFRIRPISAIEGACSGKIRSTPTPAEILRTVKVSFTPPPRRAMQIPSNACRRSFSPSRTRTMTRTVSPGAKEGMMSRKFSITTCSSRRSFPINPVSARASDARLAPPAMPQSCRGRHSTILPGRRGRDSWADRKSTRLNSSHLVISYAVFCLKKKKSNNVDRAPH